MEKSNCAIFVSNSLLHGGDPVIEDLRTSGFDTVIGWSVHVDPNGDLVYNNHPPIVTGGKYIGDTALQSRLVRLKQNGSVNTLRFSVGSGPPPIDFTHIQQLIQSSGTKPGSVLFDNFHALKLALPAIDGIDLDDEDLYDQPTVVAFCQMLHGMGFDITFTPWECIDFWADCLKELNTATPGMVKAFQVQCYSGGNGNRHNLQPWIDAVAKRMGSGFDAAGFVQPGLWCAHTERDFPNCTAGDCPQDFQAQFAEWKSLRIRNGWLWQYDDLLSCRNSGRCPGSMTASAYLRAMRAGLGG